MSARCEFSLHRHHHVLLLLLLVPTFVLTICSLLGLALGPESVVPTMATRDVQKSISTIDTGPTSGVGAKGEGRGQSWGCI